MSAVCNTLKSEISVCVYADQSALLHNSGGPPISRLTWDGLAPRSNTANRNTGSINSTSAGSDVTGADTSSDVESKKGWLTVWATRRWLSGIPSSEGSDGEASERVEALAARLVEEAILQNVSLISLEKPSKGLILTIDNDWLLWVLKAKSTSNVWMLSRSAQLSRTGTRCADTPRPEGDPDMFPGGQGPIWVYVKEDGIRSLGQRLLQWGFV